jgi:hypothetical protein
MATALFWMQKKIQRFRVIVNTSLRIRVPDEIEGIGIIGTTTTPAQKAQIFSCLILQPRLLTAMQRCRLCKRKKW